MSTFAPTTYDTSNFYIGYMVLAIYYTSITVILGIYILVTLFLPKGKCCRENRCICCRPKKNHNKKKKNDDYNNNDIDDDNEESEPEEDDSYFPYSFPDTRLRKGYVYDNSR